MKKESNYLFKYDDFVRESLESEKSREEFLKYSKNFGDMKGMPLEETDFYKNYLSKFDISGINVVCPDDCEKDFDYDLLTRLIIGSFSSDYELRLDDRWKESPHGDPLVSICIYVKTTEGNRQKLLHNLWTFQVFRLFEIYLKEQVEIGNLMVEEKGDEEDLNLIGEERLIQLKKFETRKNQILEEAKWHSVLTLSE